MYNIIIINTVNTKELSAQTIQDGNPVQTNTQSNAWSVKKMFQLHIVSFLRQYIICCEKATKTGERSLNNNNIIIWWWSHSLLMHSQSPLSMVPIFNDGKFSFYAFQCSGLVLCWLPSDSCIGQPPNLVQKILDPSSPQSSAASPQWWATEDLGFTSPFQPQIAGQASIQDSINVSYPQSQSQMAVVEYPTGHI